MSAEKSRVSWKAKRLDGQLFDLALSRLGAHGRSYDAARLVMVEGMSIKQAERMCKVNRPPIYKAILKIEESYQSLGICPTCGQKMPEV